MRGKNSPPTQPDFAELREGVSCHAGCKQHPGTHGLPAAEKVPCAGLPREEHFGQRHGDKAQDNAAENDLGDGLHAAECQLCHLSDICGKTGEHPAKGKRKERPQCVCIKLQVVNAAQRGSPLLAQRGERFRARQNTNPTAATAQSRMRGPRVSRLPSSLAVGESAFQAAESGWVEALRATATPERRIPCMAMVPSAAVNPETPASGPTAPPKAMGSANRTSAHGQFFTR